MTGLTVKPKPRNVVDDVLATTGFWEISDKLKRVGKFSGMPPAVESPRSKRIAKKLLDPLSLVDLKD